MHLVLAERQRGKTLILLQQAANENIPLVVVDHRRRMLTEELLRWSSLDISSVRIYTYNEYLRLLPTPDRIIVDDIDDFLRIHCFRNQSYIYAGSLTATSEQLHVQQELLWSQTVPPPFEDGKYYDIIDNSNHLYVETHYHDHCFHVNNQQIHENNVIHFRQTSCPYIPQKYKIAFRVNSGFLLPVYLWYCPQCQQSNILSVQDTPQQRCSFCGTSTMLHFLDKHRKRSRRWAVSWYHKAASDGITLKIVTADTAQNAIRECISTTFIPAEDDDIEMIIRWYKAVGIILNVHEID